MFINVQDSCETLRVEQQCPSGCYRVKIPEVIQMVSNWKNTLFIVVYINLFISLFIFWIPFYFFMFAM